MTVNYLKIPGKYKFLLQSLREEENSQYNHLLDQHYTDECCKWYVGFLPNSGKRKTFLLDVYISLCLLQGNLDWKLEKLVLYPNAPQLSYNILPPEVFSEKSCGVSWWRQLTGAQAGRKTDLPVRLQIRIVWPFLCPSVYFVATMAVPCHRITSTTTNHWKCKVEKVLENAFMSETNKLFCGISSKPLMQCEMLCYVMFYGVELLCGSHSSLHQNYCTHHVSVC